MQQSIVFFVVLHYSHKSVATAILKDLSLDILGPSLTWHN